MMNKTKNNKKDNIWTWIHKNRFRVFVWSFAIIIPMTLILLAYVGTYLNHQKVHFDRELTANTEFVKDFIRPDESPYLNLFLTWEQLRYPNYDEGTDQYYNGYYLFNIWYEPKLNYQINSISVTPMLKTDWMDYRSLGGETPIYTTSRMLQVSFDYMLPQSPLWFVTVDAPNLYLRVDINMTLAGTSTVQTSYVKYDLSKMNPNNVIEP